MRGRGFLFQWGPNMASDPIVIRCLPGGRYQMLAKRRAGRAGDPEWWALPGFMGKEPRHFVDSRLRNFLLEELDGNEEVFDRALEEVSNRKAAESASFRQRRSSEASEPSTPSPSPAKAAARGEGDNEDGDLSPTRESTSISE